ncbi:MAG: tetratricopeptide repeat protein [Proteobacteria bacterium]|nr:tetratricopeptide repeat protein [Pseudomonadota bacterium]MBU1717344.1 tetratricopeptide repeat protein [Pseudomonadota bacterium]
MITPFSWPEEVFKPEDVGRMRTAFSRTVMAFLPCGSVSFVPLRLGAAESEISQGGPVPGVWQKGVDSVERLKKPKGDLEKLHLFIPVWSGGDLIGTAVLEGVDPAFLEKGRARWLLERSRLISRELLLVKRWSVDPLTGLLNASCLRDELDVFIQQSWLSDQDRIDLAVVDADFTLVFIEIAPGLRSQDGVLSYIRKGAAVLTVFFGDGCPVYHVGNGLFATIWEDVDPAEALKMTEVVLQRLKREGFSRGHLGLVSVEGEEAFDQEKVLAMAWQSLSTARERGPFAYCAYRSPREQEQHPLRPVPGDVLAQLKKLWRLQDSFAVVLVRQDQELTVSGFSKRARSLLGPDLIFLEMDDRNGLVLLPGVNAKEVESWVVCFKEMIRIDAEMSFSAGIALYPCGKFKKTEIPLNARKALLHAGFFGPDSSAVFDAVSLNISGDVYYNEGDLLRATKEYCRGLELDSDNVNLLNSLGVTYVQMNQYRAAIPCFEKVLRVDGNDFMALYNLAAAFREVGETIKAIIFFEKALAVEPKHVDITLQLAGLYCQHGFYDKTVELLAENNGDGLDDPGAYRFLGEAYKGLGENDKALSCLQKASRHNPRDPFVLSQLGELYAEEGQGEEIAMSLCRQAVDLDESRADLWMNLGKVQIMQNDFIGAVDSLQKSLRLSGKSAEAGYLLGLAYEKLGEVDQARKIFRRILKDGPNK